MSTIKLSKKIFDAIYDEEDLQEMERTGVIDQALGYECGVIAEISLEVEDYINEEVNAQVEFNKWLLETVSLDNEQVEIVTKNLYRLLDLIED